MKIGLFGLNSGGVHRPEDTRRLVAVAEEIGFDSPCRRSGRALPPSATTARSSPSRASMPIPGRLIAYPLPLADAESVERALHQIGALIE